MKKMLLINALFSLIFLVGLSFTGKAQLLLEDNFNYPVGDSLGAHGWKTHSGGTANTVKVTAATITYPGYLSSGIGDEVSLLASGADVNRTFAEQTSGTVYTSFLVNIKTSTTVGDYFFHLGPTLIGTNFKGRVFAKRDDSNKIAFGISYGSASAAASYTGFVYELNTTYLVVLKYSFIDGAANDKVDLFINPVLGAAEPSPLISNTDTPADLTNIGSIALRQGKSSEAPTIAIDGIRVGLKWADVISAAIVADITPPTFTAIPSNGNINVAINTTIVLTFDEAIRNIDNSEITSANVASLLTLKETDASGADVAFTAIIDADKKVITATPTTDLKNGQVYYAAIAPVEDASGNATTMSSMTFTTISATASTISDVAITETSPYFAGADITITWTSTNVTDVKIEAWVPSEKAWQELFASTPSDGSAIFTLPSDAQYSAGYKLRITDVTNANVTAESSTFTIIAVANNLLALRALKADDMVKYTGIATVTFARTSRNQKYIQDATAAVLIDDITTAPGFIKGTYAIGDGITNIVGKIALYNGLVEFVPTQISGEPATGIEIVPEVRTLASLTAADQCKLVKIEDFAFKTPTQYDVDGKFVSSKNYDIEGSDNTLMVYRTAFFESDYIGGQVPVGPFSSVALVGQFNSQMQITARSWSDMTLPFELPKLVITEIMYTSPDVSAKQEWVELYNNGTTSVDMEGFYILDSDPLHKADPIILPAGAILAPGEYYTIETSDNGQPELFPFVPDFVSIKFNFGKADEVKLFHANGMLIDSVSYNSVAPWPTSPNGGGSSLTLCDPNLDNSLASSWEASLDEFTTLQGTKIYATPGTGCILHTAIAPKLISGITVYPNPTSDELYISNPANDLLEITILSAIGKPVKSLQSAKGIAAFDLSGLPKGMYFVKMNNKTQKTTQMKKVVLN